MKKFLKKKSSVLAIIFASKKCFDRGGRKGRHTFSFYDSWPFVILYMKRKQPRIRYELRPSVSSSLRYIPTNTVLGRSSFYLIIVFVILLMKTGGSQSLYDMNCACVLSPLRRHE